MKKTLLTLILIATLKLGAFAQGYTFTQSLAPYTDLVAPTLITTNSIWDDTSVVVPIGFPFTFGTNTFSNVEITSNGVLLFNQGSIDAAIVAYDADLQYLGTTTTLSPIGYEITGATGSRIFKVEWKNAGFYDGSGSDYVNVQVWISEASNIIETRIGTSNIVNGLDIFGSFGGPANGVAPIIDFTNELLTGVFLQGAPAGATPVTLVNSGTYPFLNAPPANGTVYRYTPTSLGVAENLNKANITVFPNPTAEKLHIEGLQGAKGNITVNVYNALGQVVLTLETAPAQLLPLNVNALAKGTYLLEMISGNERAAKQFVKF